jgi:hypothetical protein
VHRINDMTMRLKEEKRLKAEAEDEAVDRYNRQQDAKAERREEEAAAAAAEATMRISRLRAAQEKASDGAALEDELRAKRACESKERRAREDDVAKATKRRGDLAAMHEARTQQSQFKALGRAQQVLAARAEHTKMQAAQAEDLHRTQADEKAAHSRRLAETQAVRAPADQIDHLTPHTHPPTLGDARTANCCICGSAGARADRGDRAGEEGGAGSDAPRGHRDSAGVRRSVAVDGRAAPPPPLHPFRCIVLSHLPSPSPLASPWPSFA